MTDLDPQAILDLTRHACGEIDAVTDQTGSLAASIAVMRTHSGHWTPDQTEAALDLAQAMRSLSAALTAHADALTGAATTRH